MDKLLDFSCNWRTDCKSARAGKKKKSFFTSGLVLNSARSLNTSQIRKSLYDTETINLDDIMKYMGFTPGRFASSSLNFAKGLAAILKMLNISNEENPPTPKPKADKEIKEESTGAGKTPDETGKDSDAGDGTGSSGTPIYDTIAAEWYSIKKNNDTVHFGRSTGSKLMQCPDNWVKYGSVTQKFIIEKK